MGEIAGSQDADVGRLLTTYYAGVEMNDTFRLTLQARTRRLVGSRTRIHARRWALLAAAGVAGVVVAGLLLRHPAMPPTPEPPRVAGRPTPAVAPRQQAPSAKGPTGGAAVRSTGKAAAPPAAVTPQPGAAVAKRSLEPLVVVIAARQPAKDGTGRALAVGDRLPVGVAVRTGKGARLTLITRRGSEYTLNAGTELVLKSRDTAALRRGEIYCRSRAGEIKLIDTAAGRIHLLGTVIDAAAHDSHQVAVTVVSGKVRLSNAHGEAVVPAGKRSVMVASLPPQEGVPANTFVETTWYDSRDRVVSTFGDIAYMVQRGGGLIEVWKMRADGSDKQRVKTYIYSGGASWLPGERQLLIRTSGIEWRKPDFANRRADAQSLSPWGGSRPQTIYGMFSMVGDHTWLLDTDSGQDTPLLPLAGYNPFGISISPDGQRLAFSGRYQAIPASLAPPEEGVWVYDLWSGEIEKMLDGYGGQTVGWAPDGRRLAATTARHASLALIDVATREVIDLKVKGQGPSFSPDGTRLAYSWYTEDGGWQAAASEGRFGVFATDLAPESKARSISTTVGGQPRPLLWSPDGTRVAYADGSRVVVAKADAGGATVVYDQPVNPYHIAWAPSGDALYLRAAGDTLLVAADGSGVIADLGGNATDSLLTPAERHHTAVASEAIREAVFQYAVGNVRYFEGHTADAKAAFLAAAEIFSGLMWRCPQAGLSANEVLLYADQAAAMALGRLKPDDQTRWEIMDDPASRCMRNLHQLVYGLLLCSEDFHGVLFPPQLGNPAAFQETLQPWVGPASVFINPITNRPYRANVALSGKALAGFPDRSAVVAFYEDSPGPDGTRGVAFLDGHGERVSQSQWEALTKSSNLP